MAVGAWIWPSEDATGWSWWWRSGLAISLGLVTGLVVWFASLPILIAVLLDALAAAVRTAHGLPVAQPSLSVALIAALRMFRRTLPQRLGWLGVALGLGLLGPAAFLGAWLATAAVTAGDAFDTALSAENLDAAWRGEALCRHRLDLLTGALAVLPLLAIPVLGWLVLPPAMVCGAVLRRISVGNDEALRSPA